jgi:hypothetical protein
VAGAGTFSTPTPTTRASTTIPTVFGVRDAGSATELQEGDVHLG